MTFQQYPLPPSAPLTLGAGASSSASFTQLAAPDPTLPSYNKIMYMRLAVSGTTFASVTPPAPTVSLKAGTGTPVPLTTLPTTIYRTVAAAPADYVGDGWVALEGNNIFLVTVGFQADTSEIWNMTILNNDPGGSPPRLLTWVVASALPDSAQPWIDATPLTLASDLLIGEPSAAMTVTVNNLGTGTANNIALSGAMPTNFSQTGLPIATLAPRGSAAATITFTAPATPPPPDGTSSGTIALNSNDPTAGTSAGHNKQVALSGRTQALEVVMLLDDSGSMGWAPGGPSASGPSRWSELESAVNGFLTFLGFFGQNKGKFGIARFPAGDPGNPATFDIVPMGNITNSMAAAQGAVAAITPVDSTPMGDGIDRVFATASSYFGIDPLSIGANRRWLLLMTDGAHNSGTHAPTEYLPPPQGTAPTGTSLKEKNVETYVAGYGLLGASNVDYGLMQKIADGSAPGSMVTHVDQDGWTASQLSTSFRDTIKTGLTATTSPRDPAAIYFAGEGVARHPITITPYDGRTAFVLSWNTPDAKRLRLELLTPNCELITPENTGQFKGVQFVGDPRFNIYLIEPEFVRNAVDPSQPRFGTWTMLVSSGELVEGEGSENYVYDVLLESRLRMHVSLDQATYYAGDPITVSAQLTVEGRPVRGAAVALSTTAPGSSVDNWLAALVVPDEYIKRAQALLDGRDQSPLFVKALAAQLMGATFDPATNTGAVTMVEGETPGVYQATVTNTTTPERYAFYVTALGETDEGVHFRREGKAETHVLVRPEPIFTGFNLQYRGTDSIQVRITPRDRFGNVLLVNPATAPDFGLVAKGGEFAGPLVSNLDGSYTRDLRFDPGRGVTITLQFNGTTVGRQAVPPITGLHWVDRVLRFAPGVEGSRGANQHTNAQAALGDPFAKPADVYVALGAGGRLAVGYAGQAILPAGDADVTVFVQSQPGDDARPYRVDAYLPRELLDIPSWPGGRPAWLPQFTLGRWPWAKGGWVTLGQSSGGSQSFSLRRARVPLAVAIRVVDLSRRTRGSDFKPLANPGVGVRGVGAQQLTREILWNLEELFEQISATIDND